MGKHEKIIDITLGLGVVLGPHAVGAYDGMRLVANHIYNREVALKKIIMHLMHTLDSNNTLINNERLGRYDPSKLTILGEVNFLRIIIED